jgi:3-hydroxyacyl-CoA dehydrogenase/enoyl-CoA hydratase/3-hydroxybutyryl-CoA epimerase
MVAAGFQGRKNRKGFYLYPEKKKKGPRRVDHSVYELFGGPDRRRLAPDEIRDRMALLMVNEAVHCLDEGVIASPEDGDLGAILGLGFPPFRGGPFRFVDHEGAAAVVDRMEALAERHGPRFEPAGGLKELARTGERFYPGKGD